MRRMGRVLAAPPGSAVHASLTMDRHDRRRTSGPIGPAVGHSQRFRPHDWSGSTNRRVRDPGFTLVEILIAIVLVGVLSAVAVVGISRLVSRGSGAACSASADASRAASAVYLVAHASYPVDFASMMAATGSGANAVPASLTMPAGVAVSGLVATSTAGGWTLTMTVGAPGVAPAFACATAAASTLKSTWPAMHDGQVGVSYTQVRMSATLGTAPYAWAMSGQPYGLTLGSPSGTVYGTPTSAGTFTVTVSVSDAAGGSLTNAYSIVIAPATVVCPATFAGWRGDYYGTETLSGPPALCRDDPAVNFDWGWTSPVAGFLPIDAFSIRWTRTQRFTAGNVTFTMGSDDGSRLYIDGVLVLDRWVEQAYPSVPPAVTVPLTAGDHTMVMEYFDHAASARATLVITPTA
ncbi:MAG: PA14 domain-containing protein [Ilumatobacteraceae bacterium]